MKIICFYLFLLLSLFFASTNSISQNIAKSKHSSERKSNIGFYTPDGIDHDIVGKVDFAMSKAYNISKILDDLNKIKNSTAQIIIDGSPLLTTRQSIDELNRHINLNSNISHLKLLTVHPQHKLKKFFPSDRILSTINDLLTAIYPHKDKVKAIFLADEPYLNGISRSEIERVAQILRLQLNDKGMSKIKIGVIFASAMFNSEFANLIDHQSFDYVKSIDNYYNNKQTADSWKHFISENRLTTYDAAGNMYKNGGLPKGVDIIGFDFYISTLLLDGVHNQTMSWFTEKFPKLPECIGFKNKTMKEIRSNLSFFQDGPVSNQSSNDREILDNLFLCRTKSIYQLLSKEKNIQDFELMLVSESSNNGLLEFSSNGTIEQGQPDKLIESRVLDEVKRATNYYFSNKKHFKAGLMFFTYEDTYDETIKLSIGGASSLKSVTHHIFSFK